MKKELLVMWVVLGILLSQVPIAFAGQCDPPGTVYREGCPREVLYSSTCEPCDPFGIQVQACTVTKMENKKQALSKFSLTRFVTYVQECHFIFGSSIRLFPVLCCFIGWVLCF